jgi:hypothetical protein
VHGPPNFAYVAASSLYTLPEPLVLVSLLMSLMVPAQEESKRADWGSLWLLCGTVQIKLGDLRMPAQKQPLYVAHLK